MAIEVPEPANPDFLHFEQGTLNRPNKSLLATHLEVAVRNGDVTRSEVSGWPVRPWTMMGFIEGKVSTEEQVEENTPIPEGLPVAKEVQFRKTLEDMLEKKGLLNGLRDWAEASVNPIERVKWEEANPDLKKDITDAVTAIHTELIPSLGTYEKTERNLNAAKGLNLVENVLRGTKEYVWDEFSEHPEMSIGLVIAGYMALKTLKGTKLMKGIGLSAAGLIGYTFLRDKFGVRPLEKLSEMADTVVGKGTGDALRTTADTVTRAVFGDSEADTINGYYYDKLTLRRDNDRQMFNHMLGQKPKELVAWYDAASAWSLNRGGPNQMPPTDVSGFLMDMEMNLEMSGHFSGMSEADKVDKMMEITERVFKHVAVENNRPATPDEGLSMLKQKYIDGEYFNMKWNQLRAMEIYLEETYFKEDPAMQERVHNVIKKSEDFYKNMAIKVRDSSDQLTMKHILFMEAGPDNIRNFNGPGMSQSDIGTEMEDIWKSIRDDMAPGAWEGASAFLGDTVPTYWDDVWNETVLPNLVESADTFDEKKKMLLDWYSADVLPLMAKAKAAGIDYVIVPIRDSKIAEALGIGLDKFANGGSALLQMNRDDMAEWYDNLAKSKHPEAENVKHPEAESVKGSGADGKKHPNAEKLIHPEPEHANDSSPTASAEDGTPYGTPERK